MNRTLRTTTALVTLALTGCRHLLPPATPVPPAPTATGYTDVPPSPTASASGAGGSSQRLVLGMDVSGQWWTLFHSRDLNAVIDEAVARNPDVDAAQAALRQARETFYAQRSSAYPNAQGSFSVSRQQVPTYYSPPLSTSNSEYVYGVHTLSLDVSYTPDVFGNLRYQTAATREALRMQRYETEATYLTLTSNVAMTAFEIASLRGQLDETRRLIATERRVVELTRTQRSDAQADGLDVLNEEATLRTTEQTVPPLEKQLAQMIDQLCRLTGRAPNDEPATAFDLASLHLPEQLPLSLPSKLVEQRPDIAAAEAAVEESGAEVDVASTNRLPNFAITAQTATQALALGGLFGAGSLLSTLTGQVAQTVYDHGTLKHREAAAIAAYDQSAAEYRGAVLGGLQNVADSMAALQKDADALRDADRSERTAREALAIVTAQKTAGQVAQPAVLTAVETDEQAELALVQARANRYMDTVGLFVALGGGWWNRTETTEDK